ncbi:putative colanic acid biosynthesis UDP-glucose lipid carrier transferase [Azonexus fungiphilus]|uniref:Putative colanic acid biosynthesis UDP-glucose lipid carrier transferase n=1 Tax=Azonexus fungiphilus TaxID=146940 RepID=A0A495VQS3_9RHOO|nr:undecaprenyl-phosphate glucose phosphotransferase [Azonexus fungiphilus]RKT50783.1 putative colanic acid biosynthesis UDP-glucose lipid carrier transferase [Azonexus fungiphilus]
MASMSSGLVRPHSSKIGFFHRLLDAAVILLSLTVALQITRDLEFSGQYAQAGVWGVMIFLMIGGARHLYSSWRLVPVHEAVTATLVAWFWTMVALVFLAFLSKTSSDYSRVAMLTWFGLAPLALASVRVSLRVVLNALRSNGRNTRTLAIAGKTKLGKQVVEKVEQTPWLGMQFIGYYDDRLASRDCKHTAHDAEGIGRFDELVALAREGKVDYIYITLPMKAENRIVELVNALSDTTASVYLVPNFFIFDLLHGKMSSLDGIPVLSLHESPFYGVDGWLKRLEDIVVASLILMIIALPMAVIALGVKLTSPGPVLFKQRRYGLNGAVVEVWKFRSMTVCEDGDKVVQASKGDMRITPFGAFLRRTSLDELPQFINVLQGQMSVVGPRPHAVAHNEQYRKLIRGYMLRHKVKPGITGWAQISGWRGETETLDKMEMRVKYDLEYVQNWSLWLDIKIIFLTVFKGFINKNAY